MKKLNPQRWLKVSIIIFLFSFLISDDSAAQGKPNFPVIFEDDVGQTNISAYGPGVAGYQ